MKKYVICFFFAISIMVFYYYGNDILFDKKERTEGTSHNLSTPSSVERSKTLEVKLKDSSDLPNKNLDASSPASKTESKAESKIFKVGDIAEPAVYDELNGRIEFSKKLKSYIERSPRLKINTPTQEDIDNQNHKYADQISDLTKEYYNLGKDVVDHKISLAEYKDKDEKIRASLIKIASQNVSIAAQVISENYRISGFFVGEDNVIDSIAWGMIASKMGHAFASDSCHNFVRECTESDFTKALDAAILYSDAYGLMDN